MRKLFKLSPYILSVAGVLSIVPSLMGNDAISQTFFSVRPQFQSMAPEMVSQFRGERSHARVDGVGGALQFVVFGGKSSGDGCSDNKLAKFFMPFGKTSLVVGEPNSAAASDGTLDLLATYFGILTDTMNPALGIFNRTIGGVKRPTTFQSTIKFAPKQTVFGLGLGYRQSFAKEDEDKGFFLSISAPIMRVKNDLGFDETITDAGGTAPTGFAANMRSALQGDPVLNWGPISAADDFTYPGIDDTATTKQFNFGKIASSTSSSSNCGSGTSSDCSGALTKWGLADIEVKLGYECTREEMCYSEGYIGVVLPTGTRPKGEFIFEPIVGNNKHFGFMVGGSCGFEIWQSDENAGRLWFECDYDGRYLFSNTQKRSFDLINNQWSRYLWVYEDSTKTAIADIQPGINFFTQDMRVTPRTVVNCNSALVYKGETFQGEVGYNFFARSTEKVELCPGWKVGPGIAGFDSTDVNQTAGVAADTGKAFTASNANIRRLIGVQQIPVPDRGEVPTVDKVLTGGILRPQFIAIKEEDIDLRSAAHPGVIAHTFYASAGARWDDKEYPPFVGLGASYEFALDNTALSRWLAWAKFGFSF